LVIEIMSPESRDRDRREKYAEYEGAGIPEYWLIDPEARQAHFYRLGPDGRYRAVMVDESGVFRSEVLPNFWLRVEWLWQDPPPQLPALQELGLLQGQPVQDAGQDG
jgi:Uma2 family endonuclease